jgi:hypothetical protein
MANTPSKSKLQNSILEPIDYLLGFVFLNKYSSEIIIVTTLALGSQSRQGLARVRAKKESRESHFMLPGQVSSHTLGVGVAMDSQNL